MQANIIDHGSLSGCPVRVQRSQLRFPDVGAVTTHHGLILSLSDVRSRVLGLEFQLTRILRPIKAHRILLSAEMAI